MPYTLNPLWRRALSVTKDTAIPVKLSVLDWGRLFVAIAGITAAQVWYVSRWASALEAKTDSAIAASARAQETADRAAAELATTKDAWQQTLLRVASDVGELKGLVTGLAREQAKTN